MPVFKYMSQILVQRLCNLLGGRGGGHQKITLDYRGEGGRPKGSQKGLRNFLMVPKRSSCQLGDAQHKRQVGGKDMQDNPHVLLAL